MKTIIIPIAAFLTPFIIGHIWYKDDNSYHLTFIMSCLLTIIFIVYFIRGILKKKLLFIFSLPLFILSFFIFIKIINFQNQKNENNASKIILSLEKYKHTEGTYPQNLSKLNPKYMTDIPKVWFGIFSLDYLYNYDPKNKSFSLGIRDGNKTSKVWESSLGQWQFMD